MDNIELTPEEMAFYVVHGLVSEGELEIPEEGFVVEIEAMVEGGHVDGFKVTGYEIQFSEPQ